MAEERRGPLLYFVRTPRGAPCAADDHLWSELRHGRKAADRPVEDRGWQQVPADLDRPPGGRGDPDEAPGRLDSAPDDPRSALRRSRSDRRQVREGLGHGTA